MNKISIFLIIFFSLMFLFGIQVGEAQTDSNVGDSLIWDGVNCNQQGEDPCTFCDMIKVIANIVNFLTRVAYVIGSGAIVMGGILMLISGGSKERFTNAKKIITNAVIGIAITSVAWIIVNTLFRIMVGGGFIWNEIVC